LEHYRKHVLGVLKDGASKLGGPAMPEFLDLGDYVSAAQGFIGELGGTPVAAMVFRLGQRPVNWPLE
jgi:hypothetical protein